LISLSKQEALLLGFACGFAFNYWWWESAFYGFTIAYWIALTWQVGEAKLKNLNDA
jgi:hypothetical protein